MVMDELPSRSDDRADIRTFCLYIRDGMSTRLSLEAGDTHFLGIQSHPKPQWNQVLLESLRIDRCYRPAPRDFTMTLLDMDDAEFADILHVDDEDVRSYAARTGCDSELLFEAIRRMKEGDRPYRRSVLYALDYSRCTFNAVQERVPYAAHDRSVGDCRARKGVLIPAAGFMCSGCDVRRPRPGERAVAPERDDPPSEYQALDWLHDRTLIDMLLDIPPYPEELADDPWGPGQDALHPVDRR